MARSKYVNKAIENDPKGATCHRCGKENDMADDVGWFFWHKDDGPLQDHINFVAVCRQCYKELGLTNGDR